MAQPWQHSDVVNTTPSKQIIPFYLQHNVQDVENSVNSPFKPNIINIKNISYILKKYQLMLG